MYTVNRKLIFVYIVLFRPLACITAYLGVTFIHTVHSRYSWRVHHNINYESPGHYTSKIAGNAVLKFFYIVRRTSVE